MPSFFDLQKFAATGIASPDMTAYDKMRALSLFGGGKTQTLTGIPPLSFRANGKPLVNWSMLGNGQQSGTPTPDNIIMPTFCGARTDNLVPPLTEWANGYISGNNGEVVNPSVTYKEKTSAFLEIPNNVTIVTFSSQDGGFETGTSGAWRAIGFYDSNKEFVSRLGGNGVNAMSVSIPEGARFMRVTCRTYGSDKEYMLNSGTALPYEPYGYKIPITCAGQTVPVYLGQVSTVRKIKKLVLTGEETVEYSSEDDNRIVGAFIIPNMKMKTSEIGYCNILQWKNSYSQSEYNRIVASTSDIFYLSLEKSILPEQTFDGFITYLRQQYAAGTPVTVWYALATPTTGIVNEPLAKIGDYADELHSEDAGVTIPTAKGENTLTVDTELPPSEMTITYKE